MIMTEEEWYDHCIQTGCSMSYEKYVEMVEYVMKGWKKC